MIKYVVALISLTSIIGTEIALAQEQRDSLLNSILLEGDSKSTVDKLNKVADSLIYTFEREPFNYLRKSLAISKKLGYKRGLGISYRYAGNIYRLTRFEIDSAKMYYDSSAQILKEVGDRPQYGRTLRVIGAIAQVQHETESAKTIYYEAIKALESGDEFDQAVAKEQLSYQLLWDKRIKDALKLQKELLAFYEKKKSLLGTLYFLEVVSRFSSQANDSLLARQLNERMFRLARKYNLKAFLCIANTLQGELLMTEHRHKAALHYLLEALVIGKTLPYRKPRLYEEISQCYAQSGDRKKAAAYLHIGLRLARQGKFKYTIAELLLSLAQYNESWGLLDSALYYQKQYKAVSDSIAADNARHVSQLENSYQAKQRLAENEQLKKDIVMQRVLTFSGVAVMLLLGGLVAVILKSRKEIKNKNRILTEKNDDLFLKNNEILAQNEEILAQQDQLSTAYENAKTLSELGKDIARCLSPGEIVESVHKHISMLMEAPIIGIALVNESDNILEFPRTIKNGNPIPPFTIDLSDQLNMLVWCIKNKEPIMTSQFYYDHPEKQTTQGAMQPSSLICVPLIQRENAIGLIYIQCYIANAYNEYHLNLLKNVALYILIAIENSETYKIIVDKNEMLSRYNTVKDKLFSVVSHDLRGPMNSLRGLLQLINSKTISETQRNELLTRIDENFRHTQQLVDNVLHWANAQIRGVDIIKGKFDLQLVSNQTINLLSESIKGKEITIENKIPPVQAFGDENMIQLVLRNLISNAIKFTPRGGKVSLSCEETEIYLKVGVVDTGVGMPKEFQKNLFQMEIRHTTYGTEKEKGTGLGLSLCKEFIEKNEGKIWVESEVNQGSAFYFTIPRNYTIHGPTLIGTR